MGIVRGAMGAVRGATLGRRPALLASMLVALGVMTTAAPLAAQTVQTDPLQCWWRTSSGAIRVGQTFQVVLTCAVLETEAATVVVDQTRLEPSVLQFPPFEVIGGAHGADLRTEDRHFFQYEYRLRLIAENMFGKDVQLPELKINYRVQSKVSQNTSLQGRDQAYMMPAASVRVLSLVPSDATDIRDSTTETFSDLDQRALRANLFVVIGTVLFVLAGLLALLVLMRLFGRLRKPATVTQRLIADSTILRGVSRELSAIRRVATRQRLDGRRWRDARWRRCGSSPRSRSIERSAICRPPWWERPRTAA